MNTEKLSFKEREQLIRYLFFQYESNKIYGKIDTRYVEEQKSGYLFSDVFEEIVELTLTYLSIEERRIIEHEFILKSRSSWWMEYYSRSTFYRIKGKAMEKFINCLHNRKMI